MVYCESCGNVISSPVAKFCRACGSRVEFSTPAQCDPSMTHVVEAPSEIRAPSEQNIAMPPVPTLLAPEQHEIIGDDSDDGPFVEEVPFAEPDWLKDLPMEDWAPDLGGINGFAGDEDEIPPLIPPTEPGALQEVPGDQQGEGNVFRLPTDVYETLKTQGLLQYVQPQHNNSAPQAEASMATTFANTEGIPYDKQRSSGPTEVEFIQEVADGNDDYSMYSAPRTAMYGQSAEYAQYQQAPQPMYQQAAPVSPQWDQSYLPQQAYPSSQYDTQYPNTAFQPPDENEEPRPKVDKRWIFVLVAVGVLAAAGAAFILLYPLI